MVLVQLGVCWVFDRLQELFEDGLLPRYTGSVRLHQSDCGTLPNDDVGPIKTLHYDQQEFIYDHVSDTYKPIGDRPLIFWTNGGYWRRVLSTKNGIYLEGRNCDLFDGRGRGSGYRNLVSDHFPLNFLFFFSFS